MAARASPVVVETTREDLRVIKQWLDQGKKEDAYHALVSYLIANVEDSDGWFLLGRLCFESDNFPVAWMIFDRMRGAPECRQWPVYMNLASALDHLDKHEEAVKAYKEGLEHYPDNENLLTGLGTTYVAMHETQKAIEVLEPLAEKNPGNLKARSSLGFAYLQAGDWGKGWDLYQHGYGKLRWRTERVYRGEPEWQGEKGKDVHLVVHGEQGVGDQLVGIQPVPDLAKDVNVVAVEVNGKVANLIARSLPGIDVYPTLFEAQAGWPAEKPKITHHCGVFHVHKHYRKTAEDYDGEPWLVPDPDRQAAYKAMLDNLGPGPKIGVTWSGGVALTGRKARRMNARDWMPVYKALPNAHFVCLEYRDRDNEVEELERKEGIVLHNWPWITRTNDMDDVTALVSQLDAVVTVPTTVVHLAGATGVPAYVLMHERPNIHYGSTGDYLIYYDKRVRLYRPHGVTKADQLKQIAHDIGEKFNAREAA